MNCGLVLDIEAVGLVEVLFELGILGIHPNQSQFQLKKGRIKELLKCTTNVLFELGIPGIGSDQS